MRVMKVSFELNGENVTVETRPNRTLLDLLRDEPDPESFETDPFDDQDDLRLDDLDPDLFDTGNPEDY